MVSEDRDEVLSKEKPVTIVVSRQVFPGREKDYDNWVRKLVAAAAESPGYEGVTLLVPPAGKTGLHHVIMRFKDERSMHIWETSYIRQKLSHEADEFSRRIRQEATGLETWFAVPECPELENPPAWKMALVTFFAVYILSVVIIKLLKLIPGEINFYLETFIVAGLLVSLLTWVVMPFLSRRLLRRWLHR
ncbi:MAG: hypothetical protein N2506_06650 [Dehalococcoidales bacterium]|nr:hypothetical protein [Dehalococcoidales bacterium]